MKANGRADAREREQREEYKSYGMVRVLRLDLIVMEIQL